MSASRALVSAGSMAGSTRAKVVTALDEKLVGLAEEVLSGEFEGVLKVF